MTTQGDIQLIQNIIDGLDRNPVARFSYTQDAFDGDDADGVSLFDHTAGQNIPAAANTDYNPTVIDRGIRTQGASIPRMAWNHYIGRLSYNVNKLVQKTLKFLTVYRAALAHNANRYDLNAQYKTGDICFVSALADGVRTYSWYERVSVSPETISNIPVTVPLHWAQMQEGPLYSFLNSIVLEDQGASNAALPTSATAVTPLLQSVRNCLKWLNAKLHATSGHKHTGGTDDAPQIETAGIKDKNVTTAKVADIMADATSAKAAFSTAGITFAVFLQTVWRGITWLTAKLHATSGHKHTGGTDDAPQIETAGIKDANVTAAKLADGAVTSTKLASSIALTGIPKVPSKYSAVSGSNEAMTLIATEYQVSRLERSVSAAASGYTPALNGFKGATAHDPPVGTFILAKINSYVPVGETLPRNPRIIEAAGCADRHYYYTNSNNAPGGQVDGTWVCYGQVAYDCALLRRHG